MYFKLALKNVKKSFKDFLIYFLTLAFAVCLFYIFNSFQSQQAVLEMNASQAEIVDLLSTFMSLLSVFVTVVLAFLILYANNFLIRRRKRELGIYTLLGMPKGNYRHHLIDNRYAFRHSLISGTYCRYRFDVRGSTKLSLCFLSMGNLDYLSFFWRYLPINHGFQHLCFKSL